MGYFYYFEGVALKMLIHLIKNANLKPYETYESHVFNINRANTIFKQHSLRLFSWPLQEVLQMVLL